MEEHFSPFFTASTSKISSIVGRVLEYWTIFKLLRTLIALATTIPLA